jgi:hypothetical protein
MGKVKRAAKAAPRAQSTSRNRSAADDHSAESFSTKRSATRRTPDNGSGQEKRSMLAADDGILDEWLEPDEDEDLDQWLHEHGADGDGDDRNH